MTNQREAKKERTREVHNLLEQGKTQAEITEMTGIPRRTVNRLVNTDLKSATNYYNLYEATAKELKVSEEAKDEALKAAEVAVTQAAREGKLRVEMTAAKEVAEAELAKTRNNLDILKEELTRAKVVLDSDAAKTRELNELKKVIKNAREQLKLSEITWDDSEDDDLDLADGIKVLQGEVAEARSDLIKAKKAIDGNKETIYGQLSDLNDAKRVIKDRDSRLAEVAKELIQVQQALTQEGESHQTTRRTLGKKIKGLETDLGYWRAASITVPIIVLILAMIYLIFLPNRVPFATVEYVLLGVTILNMGGFWLLQPRKK